MKPKHLAAILALAIQPLGAGATEIQKGRIAFLRCMACHTISAGEGHKTGPNLRGAIGSPAARAPGFPYTDALRRAGLVWDDATLRRWILDPAALAPGTSMAYANSLNEAEIDALISFLKTEAAGP